MTQASHTGQAKDVHSSKAAEPVGKFPHAKRVGNLLFISGIGPRERGTKKIPGVELSPTGEILSYDIEVQTHSVFRNVSAILEEAGLSFTDLVDVQVFLTNMKQDFPVMNQLWAAYFPVGAPCRTTVEVGALPTPIAIELKCIAAFPEHK
jgi:2-aminomuconate deaminase